jgi:putative ABC transport system permease protein
MKGRRHLEDLAQDIRDHIEQETRDNIARGMTPEDARYAALRKFGNVARIQEDTRAVWIWPPLEQFAQDARYGLRTLRRNPSFALVAVLTLALGIGMNTAVFSVVNTVLIRPLPYPAPERLVWIANWNDRFKMEAVAGPDFFDWQKQAQSFEKIAAYGYMDSNIEFGAEADRHRTVVTTPEFWAISGAQPVLGRLFSEGERDELVLGYSLFERRFGGNAQVIGKVASLDGHPVTIIGVLPKTFRFLPPIVGLPGIEPREVEAYAPSTLSAANQIRGRNMAILNVVAKLKPTVGVDVGRAEMKGIQDRIASQNPRGFYDVVQLRVLPLHERLVANGRRALLVLFAAVAFVLLIACANMANLLLARASSRQKEIAIRAALGAGRRRLLWQFLAEGVLLALLGGAAGLGLARWAIALMIRLSPQAVPRLAEVSIDVRALLFTLGVSLATGILFGLSPAISFSKHRLHDILKEGGRTSTAAATGGRLRAALVAAEVGLAVVLLVGAGLLVKSFWRMNAHPAGFDPERVLTMKVSLSGPNYAPMPAQISYINQVLERAQSVPGVEAAGIHNTPLRGLVGVEGQPPFPPGQAPQTSYHSVSAGYLRAIGMAVVKGRWVTDDEPNTVAVVNEAFAHRVFGSGDPIGRRIRIPRQQPAPVATIVGVVGNLKYSKLDAEPEPETYIPYRQSPFLRSVDVVVRTARDPGGVAPALRKLISGVDARQPVFDLKTLEQALSESIAPRRFNMFLLGTFAATALLMAVIGIYGIIAYSVTQRTHEIGVRTALGAQRGQVVRMVIWQGMGIVLCGIGAGLLAALGLTRLMASLLYDVQPADAPTFAVVASALAITALLAIWGPAFRAAQVDPMIALRYE